MRYYLVAGESSGDLHGSNLMREILSNDAAAEFRFFGGDKMQQVYPGLVSHYKERAFMGLVDVLLHIRTIRRFLQQCVLDICNWKPDIVIFIDNPGFNMRVAKSIHSKGFKICYYIAPKVWAWNQKRVYKLQASIDKLLCILPFEIDFFKQFDIPSKYVGNPLLDELAVFKPDDQFLVTNQITKPIISLLPGSRKKEIEKVLPDMLSIVDQFPNYQFVVACTNDFSLDFYKEIAGANRNVKYVFANTYNVLHHSEAALVTSGTATLETALFHIPQVVCYKTNGLTYAIAKNLIKVKYISLVNLILDKKCVTELIQNQLNNSNLQIEVRKILVGGSERARVLNDYSNLSQKMGAAGASKNAAEEIAGMLRLR